MTELVIPLSAAAAVDAERVGPKAANLAALSRAGLPTPGGFVLNAEAYRAQIAALGLEPLLHRFDLADGAEQRRLSVEIRLALYEQPVAPDILEVAEARRARGERPARLVMADVPQPKDAGGDSHPYAHPRYWSAFVLFGDPN